MGHHDVDDERKAARKLLKKTQHDYVLAELVGLVEESHEQARAGSGGEALVVPVTLTVGGLVISGTLTSYVVWAEAASQVEVPELAGTLRELFGVGGADADLSLLTDVAPKDRRQLHLVDAQVGSDERRRPWRGRLSQVSGWSIG